MPSPFSDEWAVSWGEALNASDAYRSAAAGWEGAILLEATGEPDRGHPMAAAVFLDLHRGQCRGARQATASDEAAARFVISGTMTHWMSILHGEVAPTVAIMRGQLTLRKGSLVMLMPHVAAAGALVRVAQSLMETPNPPLGPVATTPAVRPTVEVANRPAVLASTSASGLRFDSVPMRLWEKAKRLGIWNPAHIDFGRDREDWEALRPVERDFLLRLASLFLGGEEAVTFDILPLLDLVAREGRLEETMYLTSFVFEEAKHVEGMRRFLDAVGASGTDLAHFQSSSYHRLFLEELPASMGRLREDASPVAQARASATYNMIVEGVLAETGYFVFHQILVDRGILPGMQQMTGFLKQDESRHIAYGLHLLSRLVAEHGEPVWLAITERMNTLLDPAVSIITDAFDAYDPADMPFGLTAAPFVDYATGQFRKRMNRLDLVRRGQRFDAESDAADPELRP